MSRAGERRPPRGGARSLFATRTACASAMLVPTLLMFILAPTGCGGLVDDGDDCTSAERCADAGVPRDATSALPPADGTAPQADAYPSRDANASPQDATVVDVGEPDVGSEETDAAASPATLPSTAPCQTGGNVLWLQANAPSFWYTGSETITDAATFGGEAEAYYYQWDGTYVQVRAAGAADYDTWTLSFNSWDLDAGLQTGVVYDMAPGGSDLIGYERTCDGTTNLVGQFRVDEFSATDDEGGLGTLVSYSAAFWARCDNTTDPGPPGVLQGCVHYAQ